MKAEILSYSRAKGLFAGVSLEGSTLRSDGSANEKLYGQKLTAREIIRQGKVKVPACTQELVHLWTPLHYYPERPGGSQPYDHARLPAVQKLSGRIR